MADDVLGGQVLDPDAELLREVDGEHDLCELALAVGAHAAVAARQHHVVEIDRRLPDRRNVDDPRRRARATSGRRSSVAKTAQGRAGRG
mgnify:CR=1 FL=1